MADEQTADFFLSAPPDDAAVFAAPSGSDSGIGEVFYGSVPDAQTTDFFAAPPTDEPAPAPPADAPIILGDPGAAYDPPPVAAGDADMLGFAGHGVVETVSDDDEPAAEQQLVPAEPTAMARWNEEWGRILLQRKEEENATKAAHVEKAREEIAAFQAERERRRESRMAKNRSDEQDKLEAIEADLENDNSWQRVVKMIELNQDSADGAADTGRMKDVLVLLKNEPARAEALST